MSSRRPAAIFDLDRTIIPTSSARVFQRHLAAQPPGTDTWEAAVGAAYMRERENITDDDTGSEGRNRADFFASSRALLPRPGSAT